MRVGCAAYSYREALTSGTLTLEEFVDRCAGLGLDGVELTSYYFPRTDREYLNQLKRHCFRRGQHILATAVGSTLTLEDEGKRREQLGMIRDWIEHSVILGSPCLRVFAGPVPPGDSEEQAFRRALEALQECVEAGARAGVSIALENHGGVTATARQVQRFLEAINSPWFGVNLDLGNFADDPYREFEELAPRTITTHAKLTSRFGQEQREIDYVRVRGILEKAGYSGYVSIEYEEEEDPNTAVPRFARHLMEVFK